MVIDFRNININFGSTGGGGSSTGGVQNYQIVKSLDEVKEPKEGTVAFVQTKTENVKFYGWVFDNSNFAPPENFVAHIKYNGITFVDIYYSKESNSYAWIWNSDYEGWQKTTQEGHTMWYKIDKTAKTFTLVFPNLEGYSYEKLEESVVVSDLTVEIPFTTQHNIHHRTLDNEWIPDYYYLDDMTQAERKVLFEKLMKIKGYVPDEQDPNVEFANFLKEHPIFKNIYPEGDEAKACPQEFQPFIFSDNDIQFFSLLAIRDKDSLYLKKFNLNSAGEITWSNAVEVLHVSGCVLRGNAATGSIEVFGGNVSIYDAVRMKFQQLGGTAESAAASISIMLNAPSENPPEGMPANFRTEGIVDMLRFEDDADLYYFSAQFLWYDNTIYRGIWTLTYPDNITLVSLAKV